MSQPRTALIVLTSVAAFPGTTRPTGYYIDEMAAPYVALKDAGFKVTISSIAGGEAPIDPASLAEESERPTPVTRVLADDTAQAALKSTIPVAAVNGADYGVVYLPGGHGTMWDFRQSEDLSRVVSEAWQAGAVVGAVCHGPSGLIDARDAAGAPIVKGRRVNSFTNAEEAAVGLERTVPYLLETALKEAGGVFESAGNFAPFAVRDGNLVTGQNPASAERVATLLLEAFAAEPAKAA